MDDHEHLHRLNRYFDRSRLLYDVLLWGARHFSFHPPGQALSEREAQVCMQDLVGKTLQLSSGMRVLDAGCGGGLVAVYLAQKFACHIHGIDIRPGDIIRAQRLAEQSDLAHRVEFSIMDYADLTFADESFDAIYTLESLSHATQLHTTLEEFHRVLKRGGKLALFEYTIANDDQFSASEQALLAAVIHASAMDGLKEFRHDRVQ
jgi:sterol 24-C-methyltransferase